MNPFHPADYLSGLNINVMRFGLQAIRGLLTRLGCPQNDYPCVLVGGTNGKGSTAAILSSILRQAGLRTGLYTSPHLVDVRERIVVNGRKISRRDFRNTLFEIHNNVSGPITYFECLTAAAFLHFSRQQVDIAVVEVGLGGRLDATNVCRPLVSVITNIALEHTDYLGHTLTSIAREKAGIIKRNGLCLTAATQKKVVDVFDQTCRKRRASFFRLGADFKIQRLPDTSISFTGRRRAFSRLLLPLQGDYQLSNLALALAAVEALEEKGFRISDAAVRAGVAKTRWEGRLETLMSKPLFLLDGAHNPAGMELLYRSIRKDFSWRRLMIVFAALSDKDYGRMFSRMAPLAFRIFLPPLSTPRAVDPRELAALGKQKGYPVCVCDTVLSAVRLALACAGKNDLILACGSLYLAGEVKQIFPETVQYDKTGRQIKK